MFIIKLLNFILNMSIIKFQFKYVHFQFKNAHKYF